MIELPRGTGPLQTDTPTATPTGSATQPKNPLIELIHAQIPPDTGDQIIGSAIVLGVLALIAVGIYLAGPWIRQRYSEEVTEALQSVTITAFGGLAAVLLVVIWRLSGDVGGAMRAIAPGPAELVRALVVGMAFGLAYAFTRLTKHLVRGGTRHDALTRHQREVVHHVVQILVFVPVVMFALRLWGWKPTDLLLGAGAIGIIVGLAARQTLGAVIAGFVLLFSRPFEVGDWVIIDEQEGIVTDVTVVNTEVRTFDDEIVMIPNDEITASHIVNRSRNGRLRIQVDVGVDYDTDIGHAADVAMEAMQDLDEPRSYPKPDVAVKRLGDSAVVLSLRFWISDPTIAKKWDAQNAVVEAVKGAFEREGIKIPFPQRELAGREEAGGFRVRAAGDPAPAEEPRTDDGQTIEEADAPASTDGDDD